MEWWLDINGLCKNWVCLLWTLDIDEIWVLSLYFHCFVTITPSLPFFSHLWFMDTISPSNLQIIIFTITCVQNKLLNFYLFIHLYYINSIQIRTRKIYIYKRHFQIALLFHFSKRIVTWFNALTSLRFLVICFWKQIFLIRKSKQKEKTKKKTFRLLL